MDIQEYKKRLAIKMLPAGFILGGVIGFAYKDWNIKNSWKFALGAAALGTIAATIILSYKFKKIDESQK